MTPEAKITPSDIESKFREIQGQVDTVSSDSKKQLAVGGTVFAIILLTIIYLMGQKSGKKKSTVLEIRRL